MKAALALAMFAGVMAEGDGNGEISGTFENGSYSGSRVANGDDSTTTGQYNYDDGEMTASFGGSTSTEGDRTEGNWVSTWNNGTHDAYNSVNYVVTGDRSEDADRSEWTLYKETVKKFDQYFWYSLQTKNLQVGEEQPQCQLDSDCGGLGSTKCCVNAVMLKDDGTQHQTYRCMTKAVAQANMEMTIDDFTINIACESGAKFLGVGLASAAMVAATLY